ncbi:MAG: O-antigen ligase family protein [Dehalococcoidia bacterium]
MLEVAVIFAAQIALLIAVVVLREPKLLIPCVVIGLPIEVVETKMLDYLGASGESGARGAIRSLLNPGQAAMAATVVIGALRLRHNPMRLIPDSAIVVPMLALFAVLLLGVAWSDTPTRPSNSVLILFLYVAFVFVAPTLIEDRRDVERIIGAFLAVAVLLAVVAVAQRLLGVFNWRTILVQSDDYSYRSNATFADPNNLARYFAITLSLAAALVLATGPRRQTLYLAVPALAVGAIGIVATASRSGWLALLLCGFITVMLAPIPRYTKLRLSGAGLLLLGTLLALLLWQGGADAERVRSLAQGVQIIGQREFLIRAGWDMFTDSPLIGLGSGNFERSLITSYLHHLPTWARTTLSHTSAVSLMAELGIVGIAVFSLFAVRVGITTGALYVHARAPFTRLLAGWLGASFITILLQSQSEGRLLDEPYLWLLLAMLIAFETSPELRADILETDEPGAAPVEEQPPLPPRAAAPPPRRSLPEAVPGAG